MKKIISSLIGATFLLGCSTITKDEVEATSQTQNKENTSLSFETRMKEARKPFSFVTIEYMDVVEGKEELYLEVEAAWQKIHEKLASDGKILEWGLAKARENKFGYEYVTWKVLRSRGALDKLYDFDAIKKWMGENEFEQLMAKTMQSRKISGSELMELEDYTLGPILEFGQRIEPKNLMFHIDYMTPAEGKTQEYVEMEKEIFQPRHQKGSELNRTFQFWRLMRKISHSNNANKASHRTVNVFRKDVKPLSEEETEKIQSQLPSLPKNLNFEDVMKLRKMERVTFDVVLMTDPGLSAEAQTWKKLTGTWTATNDNGSYRTKIITPYLEEIKYFDASGKQKGHEKKPMSIEIKNDLKFFSAHMPGGSYTSIFEIHNDKWYEQSRSILNSRGGLPDKFFVYEKSDKPAIKDRSFFTKSGKDVDLVKSVIENYAAGKLDEYKALFTKDAKVTHNNNEQITISDLVEIHKSHHNQISGPVKILSSNYEVVATANGNKYGHAWITLENTYKNGVKAITPVFVSFGINSDGKIYFEHALYDTANIPSDSAYNN